MLKLYEDHELKRPLQHLDLGIVKAGTSQDFVYYLHNDSGAIVRNIEIRIDDPTVQVKESPDGLKPHETRKLILTWSPSRDTKKGLKVPLVIEGEELWL